MPDGDSALTDRELAIRVTALVRGDIGGKRREQLIEWLAERHWHVPPHGSLATSDWKALDKGALGRDIYGLWCQATRHTPVDGRRNVGEVLDRLARKLGDADAEALAQRAPDTENDLRGLLDSYVWLDDYLRCQALDGKALDFVSNTVWKREVAPKLTDADRAAIEERKRAKSPVREYEDAELRGLILRWLRDNRRYAYTYSDAAKEFRCDWKMASRVLHGLAHGPEIVMYFDAWVDPKGNKQKKKLFKFAPERKTMDLDYTRSGEIVSGVLLRYVAAHPHQTKRAIRGAMREYFGYIADKVVDDALAGLLVAGQVDFAIGKQGAHLHFLVQNGDAED